MAGKRRWPDGQGSIYKTAAGRWRGARSRLGRDGKRHRKYLSGDTRREVQQRVHQARLPARTRSVGALVRGSASSSSYKGWLEDTAQHRLRPRTYTRYQELLRLHALPTLGKLSLAKLTPQHLNHLYTQKLAEGLSPADRAILARYDSQRASSKRFLWGLVAPQRRPTVCVRPGRSSHEIHPLTPEQADQFLLAAEGDPSRSTVRYG